MSNATAPLKPVKPRGIVDEQPLSVLDRRGKQRNKIDEEGFVRLVVEVGMGKVGPPQHTCRAHFDQRPCERHRSGIGRLRNPLSAAHLDPALIKPCELAERSKCRLIRPGTRIHPAHMVDDDGARS